MVSFVFQNNFSEYSSLPPFVPLVVKPILAKLCGITDKTYFIRLNDGNTVEIFLGSKPDIQLFLRKISSLNIEESAELNRSGLNIGRPRGYSFLPNAILYLLSLRIDLFNLI